MERINQCLHHLVLSCLLFSAASAFAAEKTIDVFQLNDNVSTKGVGDKIGTITFKDSDKGLEIHTDLKGLPPGDHGFHVHQKASCEGAKKGGKWEAGSAAGGHLDPKHTDKHLGPHGKGHLGDLPVLVVDNEGNAKVTLVAENLKVADLKGRSVVIHEHGDNYADEPQALGGGGGRIACGPIK